MAGAKFMNSTSLHSAALSTPPLSSAVSGSHLENLYKLMTFG
eukprot:CAMPEP_0198114120 /NCGR_PEP_ID=MMETSP1442-20131203/5596_1 /TAXON_ID= /ORGANISM="Craspedostauros australis, Strain CCMP3328" /LENGTH=41 /DNA_ID= /DNA_START= /DNA_END= /DNA_ORIENTATION=